MDVSSRRLKLLIADQTIVHKLEQYYKKNENAVGNMNFFVEKEKVKNRNGGWFYAKAVVATGVSRVAFFTFFSYFFFYFLLFFNRINLHFSIFNVS